jgi:hypothetical protein
MLFVKINRSPTKSFEKAVESSRKLDKYLSSSSRDSTNVFLKQALSMAEQTLSDWRAAEASSDVTADAIVVRIMTYGDLIRFLNWLSSGRYDTDEAKEWQGRIEDTIAAGGRLAEATKEVLGLKESTTCGSQERSTDLAVTCIIS